MNYSLYIHIPFCEKRCYYCDFNTFTGKESLIPAYISALIDEIRIVFDYFSDLHLHSIYFGGGTPSLIPAAEYQKLLSIIDDLSVINDPCEISIEANPGTISEDYLRALRSLGFNRISIGAQSTRTVDLIQMGRSHNTDDIIDAVKFSRRAKFPIINLDLINNLPWQDYNSWKTSLTRAVALDPEHFSVYSLTIEPGTCLYNWYQRGLIQPQNQDLGADMFEYTMEYLDRVGYEHYEVSNWAKKDPNIDFRCVHNLQYWLNLPYIGIGAGAHGYLNDIRTENIANIDRYIYSMQKINNTNRPFPETPATTQATKIEKFTQMQDFMWLSLRLVSEGVSLDRFENTFGVSAMEVFHPEIDELLQLELIEWVKPNQSNLRLTRRGIMLANQVFLRFI